jgi:hypothetical protein
MTDKSDPMYLVVATWENKNRRANVTRPMHVAGGPAGWRALCGQRLPLDARYGGGSLEMLTCAACKAALARFVAKYGTTDRR